MLVRDLVSKAVEEEHDAGEDEVGEDQIEMVVVNGLLCPLHGYSPEVERATHDLQQPEQELRPRGDTARPGRAFCEIFQYSGFVLEVNSSK